MTQTPTAEAPFELKGSLFTLTVLHLRETDLGAIEQALLVKIAQAPAFFANTPVVVDLDALADTAAMPDFAGLARILRAHGLVPVGVRHGSAAQLVGLGFHDWLQFSHGPNQVIVEIEEVEPGQRAGKDPDEQHQEDATMSQRLPDSRHERARPDGKAPARKG